MTRDRFMEILRYLHFANNDFQKKSGPPRYDRLFKIRPVMDLVSAHFMKFEEFEPHLSVDEQMVPFMVHV